MKAALRDIERAQHSLIPSLMERAGAAASQLALQLLSKRADTVSSNAPPLVVAGPGNNGGDAFVVARLLHQYGLKPVVVFVGQLDQLPVDARLAYQAWRQAAPESPLYQEIPALAPDAWSLLIDGLFGVGLTRPVEGASAVLVEQMNGFDCSRLALDVPSGLDSETGCVRGVCVRATHTASFLGLRPGLLSLDGPDYAGKVYQYDLGVGLRPFSGQTIGGDLFLSQLQPRRCNSHKGSYGSVGILGGASGMLGAALLAGRAALQLGAGRVYVGTLERLAVDVQQPELMLHSAQSVLEQAFGSLQEGGLPLVLACGPGLGQSAEAFALLQQAVACATPLVLDADALNLLAKHPVLMKIFQRRSAPSIVTPHPAEAARLLACPLAEVQADRVRAALKLSHQLHALTVLKGCGSVVALPDGRWFINTTGNAGLASAGTGDVLCGMIVALLAQGWPSEQAVLAAVHLHGAAADACVEVGVGPLGLTAHELIPQARSLLNAWIGIAANKKNASASDV